MKTTVELLQGEYPCKGSFFALQDYVQLNAIVKAFKQTLERFLKNCKKGVDKYSCQWYDVFDKESCHNAKKRRQMHEINRKLRKGAIECHYITG